MDEALFKRLVEEAWSRSTEVESIRVTSLGRSPEPSYPRNQQARFLRALVELVADECANVCEEDTGLGDEHDDCANGYINGRRTAAAAIRKRFVNSPQPDPNQRQPGEG